MCKSQVQFLALKEKEKKRIEKYQTSKHCQKHSTTLHVLWTIQCVTDFQEKGNKTNKKKSMSHVCSKYIITCLNVFVQTIHAYKLIEHKVNWRMIYFQSYHTGWTWLLTSISNHNFENWCYLSPVPTQGSGTFFFLLRRSTGNNNSIFGVSLGHGMQRGFLFE